ncbi:MAG TPA: hypothetical protein VGE45_09015 [Chloroflexia bacterium]
MAAFPRLTPWGYSLPPLRGLHGFQSKLAYVMTRIFLVAAVKSWVWLKI